MMMVRQSMTINKQYQLYLERVIKKGSRALTQFQFYLESQISKYGDEHGAAIIQYFIYISIHPTLNIAQKSALIQIFQHIIYVIKEDIQLKGYISQLVGTILKYFNDPSDKIRYNAISSIYNVFKFLEDDCLMVFTRTFQELPCIVTDPSAEVKQAALHLNHTMKTLLNNAILDNRDFDYQDFINILTQNFLLPHPSVKQFLIDWINTLDEIRNFDSTHYLPLFLKKLFIFLVDQNKNVRNKAEDCLKGFIDSFKLSFICSKQNISKKYLIDDTQSILILLVKIIEESIVFEVSSEIDIHVLNWLQNFSCFLVEEINLQLQPFLTKIFTKIFKPLFKIMLQVISIQNQNMRKTSIRIHQNLQKAYPRLLMLAKKQGLQSTQQIQTTALTLILSLNSCKTLAKTQIIINWIKLMGEYDNILIHEDINVLIINIIQKLCDFNQKNLTYLITLLNDSIFTRIYFNRILRALIIHLQLKKISYESFVINKFICLNHGAANTTFVMLCTQINKLQNMERTSYRSRLAEVLFNFLITDNCLSSLRNQIIQKSVPKNVIVQITQTFAENKAVFIGFAFLLKEYPLVDEIIEAFSQQNIDGKLISSMKKISNVLLHPSMHFIFQDISNNVLGSKKAYLSLVMFLPMNNHTPSLINKIEDFEDFDGFTKNQRYQQSKQELNIKKDQQIDYLEIITSIYHKWYHDQQ